MATIGPKNKNYEKLKASGSKLIAENQPSLSRSGPLPAPAQVYSQSQVAPSIPAPQQPPTPATLPGEATPRTPQASAAPKTTKKVSPALTPSIVDNPYQQRLNQAEDDYQKEATRVQKALMDISNGTVPLSAGEKAQIDGLKGQFNQIIEQQGLANKSATGSASIRGYQTGSAEYDPNFAAKVIAPIITAGNNQIASLNVKMAAAVADLTEAFQEKKATRIKEAYMIYQDAAEKRTAALQKMVDATQKEIEKANEKAEKAQEAQVQAARDSAVLDLMSQGITDPKQLIDYLNFDASGEMVGDFTFEEINRITKAMADAEKTVPGIVGEWIAAKENDPNFANITLEEYMNFKEPGKALDLQLKRAQIAKIEKELNEVGVDEDPANILAYAQQYAATGAIPTGLPKGTFGVVSQTAKTLPRPKGAVVSSATGVADSKTPATEQQDYSRLYNIVNNVKRLKELDAKRMGGVVGGILGMAFDAKDQEAYLAVRKAIVDDMQRMQSGAALTEEETAFYEDYLPGRFFDTPGFSNLVGQDSLQRIENFEEIMNNRLKERLAANGLAIYGYSKVNIGGKEYAVGDTVTNEAGQTGRVLPDGTISTDDPGNFKTVEGDTDSALNRPMRNNNPLNIKASNATSTYSGVAGIDPKPAADGGKFLKFKSPQDGFNAAKKLIKTSGYINLSVDAALKRWSNKGYGGEIVPSLKNKKISELSGPELDTLILTMARREGYNA